VGGRGDDPVTGGQRVGGRGSHFSRRKGRVDGEKENMFVQSIFGYLNILNNTEMFKNRSNMPFGAILAPLYLLWVLLLNFFNFLKGLGVPVFYP
jgi:hypothetical protein